MNTTLIEKIDEAIEKRELKAFFQPQYDAITGNIAGAEALVRWIKDDGDIIPPDSFIPELEETDAVNSYNAS